MAALLPSPTAYPRQERKKSHWLSQLPLSVPSSSLSMSAFDSASVMVLESLLPSPFPILVCLSLFSVGPSVHCQACITTGRKPVGNYLRIWYASGIKSASSQSAKSATGIFAMRRARSPRLISRAQHVGVA